MKENKLIIAAAGAGKTTFLVNESLKCDAPVLITTFTIENENEIKAKFNAHCGCIPAHVTIQTWFSFLLQHGARPYQGVCHEQLFDSDIRGVFLVNSQSAVKYYDKRLKCNVCYSEKTEFIEHFFTDDMRIYTDKLAKFVCRANAASEGRVVNRISQIYPYIYIDEVQDLAGYDLEFLKILFESNSTILCVGDPRQVTYLTHWERKYQKYQGGLIKEFVLNECRQSQYGIAIDEDSLAKSHRNNLPICAFSSSIYPDYNATEPCDCADCHPTEIDHQKVLLVRNSDLNKYLYRYNPVQLRNSKLTKGINPQYLVFNFGQSKGKTFDRVMIFPTETILQWLKDNKTKLQPKTRADLYVAVTRAKYSVAFVIPNEMCGDINMAVWIDE